jgi:hypothetical protein
MAPLLAAHHFTCTDETSQAVRFDSSKVELAIYHDPRSGEIEARLSRKSVPSHEFSLPDILLAACGPSHGEQEFFQANSPEGVIECVRAMAALFSKYGQGTLAGDPEAYRRIGELARQRDEAFTKAVVQRPIRKEAEEAWRRQDHAEVEALYRQIVSDLTPLERDRLDYARKKGRRGDPASE